jgi:excisionase family DNA binding protein
VRPAAPPPRRPQRSGLKGDPSQYVLPFLAENTIPCAEVRPDEHPSPKPAEAPSVMAATPSACVRKDPGRKPLRPAKARHMDRAPAPAPPRPASGHVIGPSRTAPSGPAAGRIDLISVSPNIVAVIERRAEAWSAPELARLMGCTGKHIYSLAKSGRMPHLRIGGMVRFDPAATAEWLRQRYVAA